MSDASAHWHGSAAAHRRCDESTVNDNRRASLQLPRTLQGIARLFEADSGSAVVNIERQRGVQCNHSRRRHRRCPMARRYLLLWSYSAADSALFTRPSQSLIQPCCPAAPLPAGGSLHCACLDFPLFSSFFLRLRSHTFRPCVALRLARAACPSLSVFSPPPAIHSSSFFAPLLRLYLHERSHLTSCPAL